MSVEDPLAIERRITVRGWKVEDGKRREIASVSPLYDGERGVAYQEGRIGEDLPDWQPHITGVTVEERIVSPWRETYKTPDEAS